MKKETIQSITFILSGSLLQMFNGVGTSWAATLAAIFGIIILFMGLVKLKDGLDELGQAAVGLLNIAIIIGAVGLIIDLIPGFGLFASIIFVVAFIFELLGFLKLKNSATIGEIGKSGVTFLLIAMGLAILTSLIGIIPFLGAVVGNLLSLIALIFVFIGWLRVQEGLIENQQE
ncbi:MAG: hypothetical protein V2I54_12935 [Bacteroidales bacterium]|jgi:hypothetical protein|nr:hypothetical protein [Bacteroidales bacterium]